MVFGRKYALHHGMIIIRSTWPMMTKDAVYDLGGISELSFPLTFIMRNVLITWGIPGAPSRFSSLHFHLSGSIPGPSSNSYRQFQSYCSIQLLCSCRTMSPLASGIPVPQVPAWLWSDDSPVCTAFLRQVYGILLLLTQAQICGSSS